MNVKHEHTERMNKLKVLQQSSFYKQYYLNL